VLVGGGRNYRNKGAGNEGEQSRNKNEALHLIFLFASAALATRMLTIDGVQGGKPVTRTVTPDIEGSRTGRHPQNR
jgi:hypothetical protein